ncbi:MAG: hypothetical protein QME77_13205 [bacterium]|nr:hypothetical protein [bacterium]
MEKYEQAKRKTGGFIARAGIKSHINRFAQLKGALVAERMLAEDMIAQARAEAINECASIIACEASGHPRDVMMDRMKALKTKPGQPDVEDGCPECAVNATASAFRGAGHDAGLPASSSGAFPETKKPEERDRVEGGIRFPKCADDTRNTSERPGDGDESGQRQAARVATRSSDPSSGPSPVGWAIVVTKSVHMSVVDGFVYTEQKLAQKQADALAGSKDDPRLVALVPPADLKRMERAASNARMFQQMSENVAQSESERANMAEARLVVAVEALTKLQLHRRSLNNNDLKTIREALDEIAAEKPDGQIPNSEGKTWQGEP